VERGKRHLRNKELAGYLKSLNATGKQYRSILGSIKMIKAAQPSKATDIESNYIISKLKSREAIVNALTTYFADKRVKSVYLFGSVARNEHGENSDVDIYLSFLEDEIVTIFDLAKMRNELVDLLGREVDLVLEGSEYEFVKAGLGSDKVNIYG
jgi:hypothetical protein